MPAPPLPACAGTGFAEDGLRGHDDLAGSQAQFCSVRVAAGYDRPAELLASLRSRFAELKFKRDQAEAQLDQTLQQISPDETF